MRRLGLALAASLLLAFAGAPARAFDAGNRLVLPATGTVEVLFSPWNDAEARIVETITAARREIFVQAFIFTSRPIAEALIEARRRGVEVAVLADAEMNGKGDRTQIPALASAGIPVALETRYASAHNKVILVDPRQNDGILITGSYNFTFSARMKNAENVLILRDNPALARAYLDNWHRHRKDATPLAEFSRETLTEKRTTAP